MKNMFFSIALLMSCLGCSVSVHSETLYVNDVTLQRGEISNQGYQVLNAKEQSGQQDDWSTYIEAAPDATRFSGVFSFLAPTPSTGTYWKDLSVYINTLGEPKGPQRWLVQLRDVDDSQWVTIGDNSGAQGWVWHSQSITMGSNPSRYIDSNGMIKVRYRSNNAADVSNIDLLTVELQPSSEVPEGAWWQPSPYDNLTWQWQISGSLDTSLDVDMYDVDLFDTSAAQIQSLKNQGRVVICYFSAGTYEGWRSDWQTHFSFIDGESYDGDEPPFAGNMAEWDERWLDIRRIDLLTPIMTGRLDLAVSKGCDGVEPDNMDAYTNGSETQLSLNGDDQIAYNRWVAQEAHARGLSVGLKNDVDQLADLVDDFDWALNEQCFQYNECSGYQVFVNAGKAVFGVEYQGSAASFCPQANSQDLYWLKKTLALDSWRVSCDTY